MSAGPVIQEQYTKGDDIINYVVYESVSGSGQDEVLQHKLLGKIETAHVTLHPDGSVNFRIARNKTYLENAIRNNLLGYRPEPSTSVRQFIAKVRSKL